MKKQILDISLLFIALSFSACDFLRDEESEQEVEVNFENTLGQNLGVFKARWQITFIILRMMFRPAFFVITLI